MTTFRTRAVLAVGMLILSLSGCSEPTESEPANTVALARFPGIAQLATQLESGDLSSTRLVTELQRRAQNASDLNTYITVNTDGALADAATLDQERAAGKLRGPLHGIPIVVKDNIHVKGLANTAGTPSLKGFVPVANNPVVQRLVDAGAIVLGKTNLHELAFGITSDNVAFGAVANPFDVSLFAGGSSGGTASAISAGLAPAGLGTDTGGSARIPAALTGIVGFRPSTGRYPSGGVTPISHTRDTVGLLGRRVADIAILDQVIASHSAATVKPVQAHDIVLGVPRNYFFDALDDEVATVMETSLIRLREAGVTLIDTEVPGLADLIAKTAFPIALYEVGEDLPAYLEKYATGVTFDALAAQAASPDVQGVFGIVRGDNRIPADVYTAALEAREALRGVMAAVFRKDRLDALVFPTTVLPARPVAGSRETVQLNGEPVPTFPTYIRNTDPASIAALPAISLPAGLTPAGLPVGLELDGPEGSDERLIAVAAAIESVLKFDATPPPRSK